MNDACSDDRQLTLGLLQAGTHLFGVSTDDLAEIVPVSDLEALPTQKPEILGSITLRGVMIPVLDPLVLCDLPGLSAPPRIVALIRNAQSIVALAMDSIAELRRVDCALLQTLEKSNAAVPVQAYLPTDSGTIKVLDAQKIFECSTLPRANRSFKVAKEKERRRLLPYLTFESGGVCYAIGVNALFNTVPSRELDDAQLATGVFLGNITYLDRRIPVVDTNKVLNMQASSQSNLPEIVVIHVGESRLLGLAVDRILRIEYFPLEDIDEAPAHLRNANPLIGATLNDARSGLQVLILDAENVAKMPVLEGLTELSDPDSEGDTATEVSEAGEGTVIKERSRNLVFLCGREFAVPIKDITHVIQPPRKLTPWKSDLPGLMGLFFFEKQITPLIHLGQYLGEVWQSSSDDYHVLICGEKSNRFGFLVEAIKSIASSDWRTAPAMRVQDDFDMVHILGWPENRITAYIELGVLAQKLTQYLIEAGDALEA